MNTNKIRAVFYDLGDIFFEAHYWRRWMYETLTAMGKFNGSFKDFYQSWERFLCAVYEGKCQYNDAYCAFLRSLQLEDIESFTKTSYAMKSKYEAERKLFDGVEATLCAIKDRGIMNIVVTDNELPELEVRSRVLGRFNINQYIHGVVSSSEAGATKSGPALFEFTLRKFNVAAGETIFVGHDREELRSALDAGITPVAFNNYLGETLPTEITLHHFSGLIEVLDGYSVLTSGPDSGSAHA